MMHSFDDLVVVPALSLNPKKAKKKMQKSAKRQEENAVALEDSVVAPMMSMKKTQQQKKEQPLKQLKQLKPQKEQQQQQQAPMKKPWSLELEEMSTSASEGEETSSSGRSSPAVRAQASSRVPCSSFAEMLEVQRSWSGLSWFDVTEDDEDDFILALKTPRRSVAFSAPVAKETPLKLTLSIPAATPAAAQQMMQTSLFLERFTGALDASVLAQVFLCLELRHVGSFAVVCKGTKAAIWDDIPFWHALGGPVFAREMPEHVLELANPTVLRNRFRVWVYGLEGDWADSFRALAEKRDQVDVFAEAAYMLAGMEPSDGEEEIAEFCQTCAEQLAVLDATDSRAKDAAFQLMSTAVRRGETLIGAATLEAMREALEDSVERALVSQANEQLEDYDFLSVGPFELAEHLASEEAKQQKKGVAAQKEEAAALEDAEHREKLEDGCLSLAFLAALGNRHEGMDVRTAQERVSTRAAERSS